MKGVNFSSIDVKDRDYMRKILQGILGFNRGQSSLEFTIHASQYQYKLVCIGWWNQVDTHDWYSAFVKNTNYPSIVSTMLMLNSGGFTFTIKREHALYKQRVYTLLLCWKQVPILCDIPLDVIKLCI